MARWQWAFVFSTILVLPACVFQPNKQVQKKSSLHLDGEGSIFASVSEQSIREGVQADHAAQASLTLDGLQSGQQDQGETRISRKESRKRTKKLVLERAAQRQALLIDIPVPLNAKPIPDFFVDDNVVQSRVLSLGYRVELSTQEVVRFFKQGMERHGWRSMASGSAGKEVFEYFVKPDRFCSVSIRISSYTSKHNGPEVEIVIFTGSSSSRL